MTLKVAGRWDSDSEDLVKQEDMEKIATKAVLQPSQMAGGHETRAPASGAQAARGPRGKCYGERHHGSLFGQTAGV